MSLNYKAVSDAIETIKTTKVTHLYFTVLHPLGWRDLDRIETCTSLPKMTKNLFYFPFNNITFANLYSARVKNGRFRLG